MSPNLTPANSRDERHSLMYEQLIYNTLSTVGATNYNEVKSKSLEASLMLSAPKDIAVNPDACLRCFNSCDDECELCLPCLTNTSLVHLHQAYREHQRRGE